MKSELNSRKAISGWVYIIIPLIMQACIQQPGNLADADQLIVYPQPPANTRIQYLTSFSTSADFGIEQSSFKKFVFGEEKVRPIVKPNGIAVREEKIYICDTGIKGLVILNTTDGSFSQFNPGGLGSLQMPLNCELDDEGYLYVADGNRKQVVIFDTDLKYSGVITIGQGHKPTDVEVDSDCIYVTVIDGHRIEVFDRKSHEHLYSFPSVSPGDSSWLYQPSNIELSGNKILVTDPGDCTVKVFSKEGLFEKSFGSPGKLYGQFTRPRGLAADREGNIYTVDAAFENVQIFNAYGELLLPFGGTYKGPGGMWLPADIAIDYNNLEYFSKWVSPDFKLEYLIYVTNQYGPDRLSVYGFVGMTQ